MASLLLALLFSVHHVELNQAYLAQPTAQQEAVAYSFLHREINPPFLFVNAAPPLRVLPPYVFPSVVVTARSGVVLDADSGSLLWHRNKDAVVPIASLTKLMTALVVLDQGLDFQQEVTMIREDESEPNGSRLVVSPGEIVRAGDLFYTMLIGSANNATNALVRATGLSREAFTQTMNEKAHQLGLERTTFFDPTGLDPKNVSTAEEYGRLAEYVLRRETIRDALTMQSYTFETVRRRVGHTIRSTNELLQDPDLGATIAKTGYLEEAGYTFVMQTREQDRPLLVVLFNSATSDARFAEAKSLAQWAWRAYWWETL